MYYYIVLLHILGREPEGSQAQMIATATKTVLIAKFIVSRCAFCKFWRNFGCFCSVNHLSEPFRKHMFTCDWCISIHFVYFCVSRFTAAACDRPVSGLDQLVSSKFFMIFLILVSCKNKAMSASCPQQKFNSSLQLPFLFLSSLGSFSILFLRTKLGKCMALWFVLTPPPLKWLMEQKNQFEVCKHACDTMNLAIN